MLPKLSFPEVPPYCIAYRKVIHRVLVLVEKNKEIPKLSSKLSTSTKTCLPNLFIELLILFGCWKDNTKVYNTTDTEGDPLAVITPFLYHKS